MLSQRLVLLAGALALLAGCQGSKDAPPVADQTAALPPGHVPIDGPGASDLLPVTQALLDSGNAAFRQKDYDGALRFYAKANAQQPDHAAPWFGTYMVGQATKNTALSDSALRMVRERAPEMQSHPGATIPPGAMPAAPSGGSTPGAPYSPHTPRPGGTTQPGTPS